MSVIAEAIKHVEAGWTKNRLVSDDGKNVCMVGALYRAKGYSLLPDVEAPSNCSILEPQLSLLERVIREQYPEQSIQPFEGREVAHFNDRLNTTKEDVLRIMEKAAVIESEGDLNA